MPLPVPAWAGSGALRFGIDAGRGLALESYREFSAGTAAPTIIEALRRSIGEFVIPATAEDLDAIPAGAIITITGTGTLKFSGTANLLAMANPLATVALPAPLPPLAVTQGASVKVGASWEVSSEYQVRVRKIGPRRVRLGWYRRHDSEFKVTAAANAGISAGPGNLDLFGAVIGAISSDAAADFEELRQGGLDAERAHDFKEAVHRAVNRKLELSLAAELGSLARTRLRFSMKSISMPSTTQASRLFVRLFPAIYQVWRIWTRCRPASRGCRAFSPNSVNPAGH